MPFKSQQHTVNQTTPKLHQVSKILILQICKKKIWISTSNSAKRSYLEQNDNHGRNEERRNRKLQEAVKVEDNWKHLETYRIDDDDDAG